MILLTYMAMQSEKAVIGCGLTVQWKLGNDT